MADERSELESVLDIPEEQDHSEELVADEAAETEQDPVQESSGLSGDVGTDGEGSDTGETDSEPPTPAEPTEMQRILAEMAELKKANSGLYAEVRSERDRRKHALDEFNRQAEAEKSAKEQADRVASIPSKDDDPAGYLAAQQKQLHESVEQRLDRMEQAREQEAAQQVFHQAVATVGADEERFRREAAADYDAALDFARRDRARSLRASYPAQPDEWINGMIAQGDRMFALQSLQQQISPAARAYDHAVRLGYKPGAGTENGGQAAPAAAPGAEPPRSPQHEKPKMTSLSAVTGKSGGRGHKVLFSDFANADTDSEQGRKIFDAITGDPALAQAIERDGYVFL